MRYLEDHLKEISDYGYYPWVDVIGSASGPKVTIEGEEFLLFSSNNYLSFNTNPRLIDAAIRAVKKYGTGSGASRVVSGTLDVHDELERKIAEYKRKPAAMVLTSGYSTNVSLIPAIVKGLTSKTKTKIPETLIYSDAFNHASIIDGIKLSGAEYFVYPHADMDALEDMLRLNPHHRKLIITDSVFSMEGDIAPLEVIVQLSEKYNTLVLIDEAHATGVIGQNGRGVADSLGLTPKIHFIMGTLSKALGSIGGYVCSTVNAIKILKISTRGYVFSTALPPADAAVALEAIQILSENSSFSKDLQEKAAYLRESLRKYDFSTMNSKTQIVPILIGDEIIAQKFQQELRKRKIIAPCIQWPAVERGKSRIRFSVVLNHKKTDLDYLVQACSEVKKKFGI